MLVSGAGTGGAVTAIAATRQGVKTLAIDATTYPGGIGTGAGIAGYFHGAAGCFQDELDELTQELEVMLNDFSQGKNAWHPEIKKLAILDLFKNAGVEFLGDCLLCGVERTDDGGVTAVLVVIDGRLTRIRARTYTDSTGDGDLHNVRTILALTLERIAGRIGSQPDLIALFNRLVASADTPAILPPSHSLWQPVYREPVKRLRNDIGADTGQDHAWQLQVVLARTARALGLPADPLTSAASNDPRGFVRRSFATINP